MGNFRSFPMYYSIRYNLLENNGIYFLCIRANGMEILVSGTIIQAEYNKKKTEEIYVKI